jgi:beta-lactamase class A
MKKVQKPAISVLVILLFFVMGFGSSQLLTSIRNDALENYSLLAKRTQVSNPNIPVVNFTTLRQELENYVANLGEDAGDASIYFEYLPTGVSISINDANESIAASLMKVPVVMNLYKFAEEGKIDLDRKVKLKKEWLNNEYGTLYQKGEGYEITIREAARLTLKDSDNTAILLIFDQIKNYTDETSNVLSFLDLEYDTTADERVFLGARSYSSILKCLYLTCYNSKDSSQEILTYLTQSSYNNRLTLLLPEDVLVAHKIGTFSKEYQSDCGIFYVVSRNYLLCVMVKGEDPVASATIASISKQVYYYINSKVPDEEAYKNQE